MRGRGEGPPEAWFTWAHRYDAYARLAGTPESLTALLEPARDEWQRTGSVPEWCGVDLLRGWMFWLARSERFGGTDPSEWIAVVTALDRHPRATPADRPSDRAPLAQREFLRLLVWNTAWSRPDSDAYDWLEDLRPDTADIVVLAEARTGLTERWGGFTIDAGDDWGYRTATDRRKILIWSPNPWREVRTIPSGATKGRLVLGITNTGCGDITVIGVCIPWRMAHVSSGRKDSAPWQEHRAFIRTLRETLVAEDFTRPILLAGDFNQTLPRTRAPEEVADLLAECLIGGQVLTTGRRAEVPLLNHVTMFYGARLQNEIVAVVPASQDGRRLSDHDLVEVRLEDADR